jgi:cob(I)alamin adenosyltransferase
MLLSLIKSAGDTELVLTGHTPLQSVSEYSDYHTEFKCVKHPYQNGIGPRKGIEY